MIRQAIHLDEKSAGSEWFVPPEFSLDQCIKCNICTTACPVSAVTDLFPGPKYEGPQAGRFRMPDQPAPDISVDYCSGCRVCNMVCPTGVKIAELNARARAFMVEHGKTSARLRLRNNLLARPELLGKLARPVSPLANLALIPFSFMIFLKYSPTARDVPPAPLWNEKPSCMMPIFVGSPPGATCL